jgi:coenzyme F420-0:L-glutamate ligase/coenzyme F420-1:gamma-L-glutamate ligase
MNIHDPLPQKQTGLLSSVQLLALAGIPLVRPGDDLPTIICSALLTSNEALKDGDILVIAQKIVSKAENRIVGLDDVVPSARALTLASEVNKDARLVELILRESDEVVRHRRDVLIVSQKLGFVVANAGIDQSNVEQSDYDNTALLLPEDPDRTCAEIAAALLRKTGAKVGVIINDSHGRAFRNGTVGVAVGVYGVKALADLRGSSDLFGRKLKSTEVGTADEIASAASILMGQSNEACPIVLARGLYHLAGQGVARDLVRPKSIDLFRSENTVALERTIRDRRSIRKYKNSEVPLNAVEKILEAAISAPSAHNRQPWRFAVLKNDAVKLRLAHAMGARLRQDRMQDGDQPDAVERDVARSIERVSTAPIAIVVSLTMEDMDTYADARRAAAEHHMAAQSTAMAIQNMLLAAHGSGLAACIMCAPLFCQDAVRAALGLHPNWEPQALITLGYSANNGKPYQRRDLQDVAVLVEE